MFHAHGVVLIATDAVVLAGLSFLFAAAAVIPTGVTGVWLVCGMFSSRPSPSVVGIVVVPTMVAILATLEVLLYAAKAICVSLVQVIYLTIWRCWLYCHWSLSNGMIAGEAFCLTYSLGVGAAQAAQPKRYPVEQHNRRGRGGVTFGARLSAGTRRGGHSRE